MKTVQYIIITILLISICALTANAQNKLYEKYSDNGNVTKVYISKAMFSLLGDSQKITIGQNDKEIDIAKFAKKLEGLYILSTENGETGKKLMDDFANTIKNTSTELLMEVNDHGEQVKIFVIRKGSIITDFYLTANESGKEFTVMHLAGSISDNDLTQIMNNVK